VDVYFVGGILRITRAFWIFNRLMGTVWVSGQRIAWELLGRESQTDKDPRDALLTINVIWNRMAGILDYLNGGQKSA
jgi:hypothetical protein